MLKDIRLFDKEYKNIFPSTLKCMVFSGSRHHNTELVYEMVVRIIKHLESKYNRSIRYYVGDARGLDSIVRTVLTAEKVEPERVKVFFADWDKHGKYAGLERNTRMLKVAILDANNNTFDVFLSAFPLPTSRGTNHCILAAMDLGVGHKSFVLPLPI